MLEFEASYLPFVSLFKNLRQLWQLTIHLVHLPAVRSHEILYPRWILTHKIACFYASEVFPSKHECENIFMVIWLILIHGLWSTLHAEKTMRCKIVILPDSTLHVQLLGRFSKDNVTSRTTARAGVITERD